MKFLELPAGDIDQIKDLPEMQKYWTLNDSLERVFLPLLNFQGTKILVEAENPGRPEFSNGVEVPDSKAHVSREEFSGPDFVKKQRETLEEMTGKPMDEITKEDVNRGAIIRYMQSNRPDVPREKVNEVLKALGFAEISGGGP